MAQSLKSAPPLARSVSQVLPTVKCSNCHKLVPLHDLGDHVCAPVPAVPGFRPPMHSPQSAAALLPPRLQSLANAPLPPSRSPVPVPIPASASAASSSSSRMSPKPQDRPVGHVPSNLNPAVVRPSTMEDRVRSPLARSDHDRTQIPVRAVPQERMRTPSAPQRDFRPERREMDRNIYPQSQSTPITSPLRTYVQSTPTLPPSSITHRPSNMTPPPPPPSTPSVPSGIDTKIGGEAGMAGVGRRGFAAAALAAMTTASYSMPSPQNTDFGPPSGIAPRYLDMDTSRTAATPPLSPNSNSSHSYSSGPISPHAQFIHNDRNKVASRSPSPSQFPHAETNIVSASRLPTFSPDIPKTPETPLPSALSARLPFFEKYKNKLPGSNVDSRSPFNASTASGPPPSAPSPRLSDPRRTVEPESRNPTPRPEPRGPSESKAVNHKRSGTIGKFDLSALSSISGSEAGLAYVDLTDNDKAKSQTRARQKKAPPPPLNLPNVVGQVTFPLLSQKGTDTQISKQPNEALDRDSRRRPSDGITKTALVSPKLPSTLPKTENKTQPYRPVPDGKGGQDRSVSASSTKTDQSAESSSIYSKSTGTGTGLGGLNRTMETLLEDIAKEVGPRSALGSALRPGSPLTKSKSASALASPTNSMMGGSKAQRSHTVSSPDSKSHKLPGRSMAPSTQRTDSSSSRARDSTEDSSSRGLKDRGPAMEKKVFERRRVCARCDIGLVDKRWVQMDGGSMLCERCWKEMYLPKCRRCNLPIEKQAVSSSDGQLKGKYHRECFNCHKCHKPFPDKTFYVFDGKPLCAYHYHEANDSLCAASSCGQPIEGPCALSHAGDRYHPEHFLCEYPGNPKCRERLAEYWEIDGRMLCERHANATMRSNDKNDSEDERGSWTPNAKATKRVTKFIDLAGSGLR